MDRNGLADEIFTTIYEVASKQHAKLVTDDLMAKIDAYVEDAVTKARLEVMKNFKAI